MFPDLLRRGGGEAPDEKKVENITAFDVLRAVFDHATPAHAVVDEAIRCDAVGSLESAREVKRIGEPNFLGDLLHHETVVEKELRRVVHLETHQELVRADASEPSEQSRD